MRKMLFPAYLRAFVGTFVLVAVACCLLGCSGTPGETAAEVHRRHISVVRTSTMLIQDDLDAIFLLDKPSKLSDRHIR